MRSMRLLSSICGHTPRTHLQHHFAGILAAGIVLGIMGCRDEATAPTSPAGPPTTLAVGTAQAAALYQVSAGFGYTCGITTDNRAFCWGSGVLGDGALYSSSVPPVEVSGALRFRQIDAGRQHTCAVTTDNRAFCWGRNGTGQIGDGTRTDRLTPVRIGGGRLFRRVEAGVNHTCGIGYADNKAYCWGWNSNGEIGDGTTTTRLAPTAVAGGRQFRFVTAGWFHTCGVTPTDTAFCWGSDGLGQIGDGPDVTARSSPAPVAGGLRFRQLDASTDHTCGVTTGNRAYCWGSGGFGQLGDGKQLNRFTPRAVAGGLAFSRVSAGYEHSCGETTGDRGYCWGSNGRGEVGDGTLTRRLTPAAVAGGLSVSQLSAGFLHTCAVTSASVAYCWGRNDNAQLGDGTTTHRSVPVPVRGAT